VNQFYLSVLYSCLELTFPNPVTPDGYTSQVTGQRQSALMLKITNGGLDQYGVE